METQKQRTCIVKEVQMIEIVTIVQTQENMETQYMKHHLAVRIRIRGFQIIRTSWIRATLCSYVGATTTLVLVRACSTSTAPVVLPASGSAQCV